MRVLVTGATGFVGTHLVQLLRRQSFSVHGTYLTKPTPASFPGELYRCDVRHAEQIRRVLRRVRPHRIFHLAALSSAVGSFQNSRSVYEANFWGTYNLVEAVHGIAPRARVLIVGSAQVYGAVAPKRLPVSESQALAPDSPYALSKAAADLLAHQYFRRFGLHIVLARPFNHTGPGQNPEFVCSGLARQVACIDLGLQPPVLRVGNLNVRRDFSDVRDVVKAYLLLVERGRPGETYNVCSGRPVRVREVVNLLRSLSSRRISVRVQPRLLRPGETRILYGSNLKLRRATGWRAQCSLRETLSDLFAHWKNLLGTPSSRQTHGVD